MWGSIVKGDIKVVTEDYIGRCRNAVVTSKTTDIIAGEGGDALNLYIRRLESAKDETTSNYERSNFKNRLARLNTNVALLEVGGGTETELIERMQRVEDSLFATQSALRDGVIVGGGVTQYIIALSFD